MKLKLANISSNTGRFIDGNPRTGELGTIVTAKWLNDVQDRLQDLFEEQKNVLALANLQPLNNGATNQIAEAIRAYCNNLNLKIQSNTRHFDNYIPNAKKSNAVNSNSADTVATSQAVKTAYDKGAEAKTAADNAKTTADNAKTTADNAKTTADNAKTTADNAKTTADNAKTTADNAKTTADNANANANNRVSKSGDTMSGQLNLPRLAVNNGGSIAMGDDHLYKNNTVPSLHGFHFVEDKGTPNNNSKGNASVFGGRFEAEKAGNGAFVDQYNSKAPFFADWGNSNGANVYYPLAKIKGINGDGWGSALSMGYVTPNKRNQFGKGLIQLIENNGTARYWWFNHDGSFHAEEVVGAGKKLSLAHQTTENYVRTTTNNHGGLIIQRGSDHFLVESGVGKFNFIRRNNNGQNIYVVSMPEATGEVALKGDFSYQEIGNFSVRRYPDGTMIQSYFIAQSDMVDWSKRSFNWAQAFSATPLIFTKVTTYVVAPHDAGVNVLTSSNHATVEYVLYEHGGINQGNVRIQFLAIGRWR